MDKVFSKEDLIGDVVASYKDASKIFMKYKIDFCCGGNRPLEEGIKEKNLDVDAIVLELNNSYQEVKEKLNEDVEWTKVNKGDLAEYIENRHHSFLREELPVAEALVLKILEVHGQHHPELFIVHRLFNNLKIELEEHLLKEEWFLFPLFRSGKEEEARELIEELEEEHTGAGDILKELQVITSDYTPPADGCNTYFLAYRKLEEIQNDIFEHIHLENNILFKIN